MGGASPQRAQHVQRPRGGRGVQETANSGPGPRWGFGGSCIPSHPTAARLPQGPPRRSQPRPARSVVARPAGRPGASNGLPGPRSGEWSPAALMCGRPARRQLVPPRRPRAPIDTHQAAGGRERPLLRAPLTVVPGPPALGVGARAGWTRGGATRGGTFGPAPARLLSASLGSPASPVSSVSVSLNLSCVQRLLDI